MTSRPKEKGTMLGGSKTFMKSLLNDLQTGNEPVALIIGKGIYASAPLFIMLLFI